MVLKAAAGGGGKGMRVVRELDGLSDEIESAMRESKSAFGDPALIVEAFVDRGRHLEVQIAGDGRGELVHLFERECTLQRRHQKVIEEAPAANLAAALRQAMLNDAVRLGQRLCACAATRSRRGCAPRMQRTISCRPPANWSRCVSLPPAYGSNRVCARAW